MMTHPKLIPVCFIVTLLAASSALYSQPDTAWFAKDWKAASRDTPMYYSVTNKDRIFWHKQIFFSPGNQLRMEGWFTMDSVPKRAGVFKWYNENGIVSDTIEYRNGMAWRTMHSYPSGKKKTWLAYNIYGDAIDIMSWYENGREKLVDTFYQDKNGDDCSIDTADRRGVITSENDLWHLRFYKMPVGTPLIMNAWFKERYCRTRVGLTTRYYETSQLKDSAFFVNGRMEWEYKFHKNGNRKRVTERDSTGLYMFDHHWDSTGLEILADTSFLNKNYVKCNKDTAVFYNIFKLESDTLTNSLLFNCATNKLVSKQAFIQRGKGIFFLHNVKYNDQGNMTDSTHFERGKRNVRLEFFDNGVIKTKVLFDSTGELLTINEWDSTGKDVPAGSSKLITIEPPAGMAAFMKYLNTALNECIPSRSDRKGMNGITWLLFEIDKEGKVIDPKITTSSGFKVLDDCMLNAFKNSSGWKADYKGRKMLVRETFYVVFKNGKI